MVLQVAPLLDGSSVGSGFGIGFNVTLGVEIVSVSRLFGFVTVLMVTFGIMIGSGSSNAMLTVTGSNDSKSKSSSGSGSDAGSTGWGGIGLIFSLVTTGITAGVAVVVVIALDPDVICGNDVTTLSFSLGTLMVNLGTTEGELMAELGADEDDEIGEDSSELILVSLEQLSSDAAGFGGMGFIVSLGMGTSEGSRGMAGGGLGMGFMVSFGIVDVMLEC